MTRGELDDYIDLNITDKTEDDSLTPTDEGNALKAVADYIDQEIEALPVYTKTSGSITLSVTPQVLPYDINSCAFAGGIAYLPATTEIGKQIYVIAVANNIEIRANVANTNKMFEVFNTFIANVIIATNEMYRFTYIGFASEGYWKAENI